jgi:hypothetical protein
MPANESLHKDTEPEHEQPSEPMPASGKEEHDDAADQTKAWPGEGRQNFSPGAQ